MSDKETKRVKILEPNANWADKAPQLRGITFDDVLLKPLYSDITSRSEVNLTSPLTKNITLRVPLVSSNMDTVTEAEMAIAMARAGGIGILHRFCAISEQVRMVERVKRARSAVIERPYTVNINATADSLFDTMRDRGVGSMVVVDDNNDVQGIVTTRDMWMSASNHSMPAKELMTPRSRLITGTSKTTTEEAKKLLLHHRLEKLPLLEGEKLVGMYTIKDLLSVDHVASVDSRGRYLVGAAVGVKAGYLERAEALIEAGCDVLVIDIAHGHSVMAIECTKSLKARWPNVDVIAGNVASAEGVEALAKAGADGIKVGVGGGSICITRIVTGAGVPQLTAVTECASAAHKLGVPIISDGGHRTSGDLVKALAAGAHTVMLGSMLAGTTEAPGREFVKDGRKVKIVRGMAGIGANVSKAEREGMSRDEVFEATVPEGVEAFVPFKGPVQPVIQQLVGGVKSGFSYSGARNIQEFWKLSTFIHVSGASVRESGHHDVTKL